MIDVHGTYTHTQHNWHANYRLNEYRANDNNNNNNLSDKRGRIIKWIRVRERERKTGDKQVVNIHDRQSVQSSILEREGGAELC